MALFFRISAGIFFLGFALKFFHVHFHTVIMLVGLAGMFVAAVGFLFNKKEPQSPLAAFAVWLWLVALLIQVKILGMGVPVMLGAAALSLVYVFTRNDPSWPRWGTGILLSALLALSFYILPLHTRYYYTTIRWNYEIQTDYHSWDKYSWFLYSAGYFDDALKASNKALEIAKKSEHQEMIEFITRHNELIRTKSWESYQDIPKTLH
jgi:hypothetical protein